MLDISCDPSVLQNILIKYRLIFPAKFRMSPSAIVIGALRINDKRQSNKIVKAKRKTNKLNQTNNDCCFFFNLKTHKPDKKYFKIAPNSCEQFETN